MKKVIYFLMLLFTANCINAQSPIRHISRSHFLYYGADSSVNVMRDSGNYFGTTKDFYDFNKPIKINGVAISGGETLGNPSVSGMLLKSTTAGVRSWGWPDRVRKEAVINDTVIYISSIDGYSYGYRIGVNYGFGSYISSNNAYGFCLNQNNLYGYVVNTNNTNSIGFYVNENYSTVGAIVIDNNRNGCKGIRIKWNFPSSTYGYGIDRNNATGYYVISDGSNSIGVKSVVNDTVSLTSGVLASMFGKTNYYSTFDGFGRWNYYKRGVRFARRDTLGMDHGEIPSATGFDTTVNLSVNLTADVWQKVTNSTNNLWSLSNTASYITFSADTIINTYAGKYEYSFSLSANGKDGATYEYRVMKKTGTTVSVIRKIKITGGGVNVERIISCSPLLAAGDKVWVEVRFVGAPTGSPISIFGSYFTAKAVYLSL